jgi:membrane protease YdiL (CAAX protease family)
MFTNGQLIFGILFAIAFIIILFFAYRKDFKVHQKHYRGTIWILIAFVSFIAMIATIKSIFV